MGKNSKKWASTFVGTTPGNICAKFQKIPTKTEGGDRFLMKLANLAHFWLITFVGTNPENMCAKFQKIRTKTEGGDWF